MTNEEKANNLAQYYSEESDYKKTVGYDCAIAMAEWKDEQDTEEKQQWIEKACEWLKDNANEYLDWYDWEQCRVNKDELLYDFRKAMKGGEE